MFVKCNGGVCYCYLYVCLLSTIIWKKTVEIPKSILVMMSVVGGLTVANLYYNQPLLEEMRASLNVGEIEANMITVITQIGYALGLLLVVPMADMCSRRKIVVTSMGIAVLMALAVVLATNVWVASVVLGACSVVPQISRHALSHGTEHMHRLHSVVHHLRRRILVDEAEKVG